MLERSALAQLTVARMRMFFREKSAVFWSFGFPIVLSLALGVAFRNRPPEPVAVAVEEGPSAERVRAALATSPEVRPTIHDGPSARAALRVGRVALVVVPGATRTYLFDPSRPDSRLARALADNVLQRAEGRRDPTATAEQPVTEPGSRYIDFLIPGLIGMNLLSSGMWGIGYLIVDFRTRKLLKRLLATPMRRTDFLLSFVILRMLFLLVEIPLMLAFARFVFGVQMAGSHALFLGLAVLGALAFAGLGLLVASRAENTQTVAGLINLVMLPMFMCSGVFFSTANFPDAMLPAIRLLPLTALNDALRAVMNEGAGPGAIAAPALILAGWAAFGFGAALKLFRWR